MDNSLSLRLQRTCTLHHIPGASLAWHECGHTLLAQGGYAQLEPNLLVKAETIFQIGSVTKLFTGTLMMMLAEAGRVDLDASVTSYLPELWLAGSPCPSEVTVRMLLNHTSGIDGAFMDDTGDGPEAVERFVRACRHAPLIGAPGERFIYSNAGYVIAGYLIATLTGTDFNTVLKQRLLEPLGMRRYGSVESELAGYELAIGYGWNGENYQLPSSHHTPAAHAPAGSRLSMTADDLMKFALLHLHNGLGPGGRLLSEASVLAMRRASRHEIMSGMTVHVSWASVPLGDGRLFFHTGGTIEQSSMLCIAPDHGVALAILTNTGAGGWNLFSGLGSELIESATGHKPVLTV